MSSMLRASKLKITQGFSAEKLLHTAPGANIDATRLRVMCGRNFRTKAQSGKDLGSFVTDLAHEVSFFLALTGNHNRSTTRRNRVVVGTCVGVCALLLLLCTRAFPEGKTEAVSVNSGVSTQQYSESVPTTGTDDRLGSAETIVPQPQQ